MRGLRRVPVFALAALAAGLAGCSDSGSDVTGSGGNGQPEDVSFAGDIQPIYTASCATGGCHSGASPQADLNLSTGQSYAATVNVVAQQRPDLQRVHPGEADSSYLYIRLLGSEGTSVMPPGGSLPAAQIEDVRRWIAEGARDN